MINYPCVENKHCIYNKENMDQAQNTNNDRKR